MTEIDFLPDQPRFIAAACLLALMLAVRIGMARDARRHPSDPLPGFPGTVLWAWERPEDLNYIDPIDTGVAYWAGTVVLDGDKVKFHPRNLPLKVPAGTALIAVARIESEKGSHLALSAQQRHFAVEALATAADDPRIRAFQIDFDATVSQRDFYRKLLVEVRPRLRAGLPLTITALASWCLGDPWISDLPVDEAVPMLFSMGSGAEQVAALLDRNPERMLPVCRMSYGLSIDETAPVTLSGPRKYWFSALRWDAKRYEATKGIQSHVTE